jgi:aminotransferase
MSRHPSCVTGGQPQQNTIGTEKGQVIVMEKEMYFSTRAKNYPASGIRKMFNMAAEYAAKYDDVIKLTVGEPNFDTPQYIKDAAKVAIDAGQTHYSPNAGIAELREAIANRYHKYWDGYTANHVLISVGAMEGLFLSMMVLLNPGDEILVPDPCFPNYYGQAEMIGAKAVPVPTYEEFEYRMQAADVEKALTPNTRAILLNSPCNPTGAVLTKADVLAIAEVAKKHHLWVLSDEPYDSIVYDGVEPFSIAQVPEIRDQVFVLNSFSKSYAMTGWRIGFLLAPDAGYITKMAQLQEGVASCVSTFSQVAAVEALKSTDCVAQMVKDYTRRRDILIDGINAIPGFSCKKSAGSFYAFANIKAFGKTSQEFAEELLEKAHVVVVPGSAFGEMGEGYLRLVFANSDENLKEAVMRLAAYVATAYPSLK